MEDALGLLIVKSFNWSRFWELCEKDVAEISSESAQLYRAGEPEGKGPIVRMDLSLFHRRKTMLWTYYSGRLSPAALSKMAEEFKCSEKTLQNDWSEHANWEPFIWENQEAHEDGKDLIKIIQLGREEAVYLMKAAQGGNARVGAVARLIDSVKVEVELKQSLGLLPKVTQPAMVIQQNVTTQVNSTVNQGNELLAKYDFLFRASKAEKGPVQSDGDSQQVDPSQAGTDG